MRAPAPSCAVLLGVGAITLLVFNSIKRSSLAGNLPIWGVAKRLDKTILGWGERMRSTNNERLRPCRR